MTISILIKYFIVKEMDLLKSIFSPRLYPSTKDLVDSYLKDINFHSNNQILGIYVSSLNQYILKGQNINHFLGQLISRLNNNPNILQATKLLTVIHCFVVERDYNRQQIDGLQELQVKVKIKDNEEWFDSFYQAYVTYLIKIPSLSDIYRIAQKKMYEIKSSEEHLTHIFRIINQVRVLFPFITKAVTVVGRYQSIKHAQFRQLYRIISNELVSVYGYLRDLVGKIVVDYRLYNPVDLKCFLKIIPEMELACDKIQDLLVNKYIKGKKINSKIQFKEEQVAQIQYYLEYEYKAVQGK